MSINVTSLSAMSAHISDLTLEKQALEVDQKMKQSENILLVFKMHGELCGLVKECEMEIKFLESSSQLLKREIVQLELQYAEEELSVSRNIKSIAKMVISTIQSIELNFQSCRNEYPHHYHSDRVSEFVLLREKIGKLTLVEIEESPKVDEIQKIGKLEVLDEVISSLSLSDLSNIDPFLKNEIQLVTKKYENLKNTVRLLEVENQRLINQKEKIVKIHIEALTNKNHHSPLSKILTEVKATYNKIAWEQLAKADKGSYLSTGEYSPFSANYYATMDQKVLDKYIYTGKNQMESLITTLETYENLIKGR